MASKITTLNDLTVFVSNPKCAVTFQSFNVSSVHIVGDIVGIYYDNTKPEDGIDNLIKLRCGLYTMSKPMVYSFLAEGLFEVSLVDDGQGEESWSKNTD